MHLAAGIIHIISISIGIVAVISMMLLYHKMRLSFLKYFSYAMITLILQIVNVGLGAIFAGMYPDQHNAMTCSTVIFVPAIIISLGTIFLLDAALHAYLQTQNRVYRYFFIISRLYFTLSACYIIWCITSNPNWESRHSSFYNYFLFINITFLISIAAITFIILRWRNNAKLVELKNGGLYIIGGIWMPMGIWLYMSTLSDGGRLYKTINPMTFVNIILLIYLSSLILIWSWRNYFSRYIKSNIRIQTEKYDLSTREREIILYVKEGYSNKEIAEILEISANTVKNHLVNIFQKTGIKKRIGLMKLN